MVKVLEKAVEEYRRAQFLRKANAAFARLRKDRKAWKEERRERPTWDATLRDALEKE
ncbi:MAG: toxin-antitoxin system protein [Acidobacteria bacterium]|nr:MAG: toxin-antitoxin system protein [Acidobacteriota bacterium]PYV25657.1 MAG: toxin-antitoxin system protein [Acidobacteriota bacterium]